MELRFSEVQIGAKRRRKIWGIFGTKSGFKGPVRNRFPLTQINDFKDLNQLRDIMLDMKNHDNIFGNNQQHLKTSFPMCFQW